MAERTNTAPAASAAASTPPAPPYTPLSAPPRPPDPLPGVLVGGTVNLLIGAPGVGKTALLASLAVAFRDQTQIFGRPVGPVNDVAFLNVDRSWWTTAAVWFARAGFPDLRWYSYRDDPGFPVGRLRRKHERTQIFRDGLDRLSLRPGSLVMVDPVTLFFGGNLNDADACAVGCAEIGRIVQDRQLTLIGTAHTPKAKNDKKDQYRRLQDRISGSTAQTGYTDTQMVLVSPDEAGMDHYVFQWSPHTSPEEQFALKRDKLGLFHLAHQLGDMATAEKLKTLPAELTTVLELLPPDGTFTSAAAVRAQYADKAPARNTLWRWLKALEREGFAECIGGKLWRRKL